MQRTRCAPALVVFTLLSVGHLASAAAEPTYHCESAYGRNECGFECLSGYGTLECTQTPEGICTSGYGKVLCWDPPVDPRGAAPRCISGYGQLACGFECISGYGKVACTQTPWGVCTSGYGQIRCDDPRSRRRRHSGLSCESARASSPQPVVAGPGSVRS